ncbi:MAG: N-glycosylase/DNA lyase [Endomicrobium sp.]|jgi:N-glycosylase/DNA lyase|nr:N-glycosylase/DNA lyase [Endomicrobium sp.]
MNNNITIDSIKFLKTPSSNFCNINNLKDFWKKIKKMIIFRENHFTKIWEIGTDTDFFAELMFCLFTPQSKAILCWQTVINIMQNNLFSDLQSIENYTKHIRFGHKKAKYLIAARDFFTVNNNLIIKSKLKTFKNIYTARSWIVKNIKGIGYKEASHFLRNIGMSNNFSILDRHILKNLLYFKVIDKIPKILNMKIYLDIETKMKNFATNIGIPISHLDMLFWCKNTGGIFK